MGLGEHTRCQFVPPFVLRQIADAGQASRGGGAAAAAAAESLALDEGIRTGRAAPDDAPHVEAVDGAWTVYTADQGTTLPGLRVRGAGEPATGDAAVDEAAVGGAGALALFAEVYGRESFDGEGAEVVMTVHYGRNYDNAFWNGTQLVFGDGDGQVFDRFTKPVDVLGHELTHAVTEHTAGLVYRDQPGALNESMSDVFACCAKQRMLGQDVTQADWLIGAGLFLPGIRARALRDMANPGTAYDDPMLGRDPQVGHLDDYVQTTDDNGGVHLNSGIPNRAFHLAATGIGGTSWDGAGAIWYAALTGPDVGPTTDFAGFAAATVAAAGEHAEAVRAAWTAVGVAVDAQDAPADSRGSSAAATQVAVRRTGGFAGLTRSGSVDLAVPSPRTARVRELVDRVDLASVGGGEPQPDRYSYTFCLPGCADVDVPEQHLTPDLRELADLVLESDEG
ncbi:protealysin inhibitor emfourin [Nocardioides sp.]|uniref:protealysin inhibitor emfourin n=1 Tax=Nocardioides sp. TaxID=35761 RepID=UPI00352896B2